MISEMLFLALFMASGAWIALAVIARVGDHLDKPYAGPFADVLASWQVLFVGPVFLYARRKYYWLRNDRIHGTKQAKVFPHKDPILGIDWLLDMIKALKSSSMLEVWHERFAQVGSTFWHLSTGTWMIITTEPENMKTILATNFDDWPIGGVRLTSMHLTAGKHSIFAVNGKEWHDARSMIRPSFTRNQIADLECQDRHVERLLGKIPRDGSVIELQNLFYLMTMDSATDFMFGYSTNTLANPAKETLEFARCFDHMLITSAGRGRLGWMSFFFMDKEFDKSVATCRKFIEDYVSKALADSKIRERPYIFLNELVESGASREQIRDQLLSMIIGGRDTSAGTLSSLFWILARRPDVFQKAKDEVASLEGRKPSWEDLKGMKYVNNVLKETLRLHPAVATNMRMAARDTVLPKGGGPDAQSPLFVPAGTQCRWSLYTLQRRKDVYGEDAEEFRPERWEKLRVSWEYVAFNGGPRICIGQQFALTQMAYVLTRVLQTFDGLEACDDRPMRHVVGPSTSLLNGCWVRFKAD